MKEHFLLCVVAAVGRNCCTAIYDLLRCCLLYHLLNRCCLLYRYNLLNRSAFACRNCSGANH